MFDNHKLNVNPWFTVNLTFKITLALKRFFLFASGKTTLHRLHNPTQSKACLRFGNCNEDRLKMDALNFEAIRSSLP